MRKILLTLDEISSDPTLLAILAYPSGDEAYSREILGELSRLGVEGVYFSGEPRLEPLRLGKGYRGVVFLGRGHGADVALKILRTDAGINDLRREAELTIAANRVGVGPRLIAHSTHVLVLEYIAGEDLDSWLAGLEAGDVEELKIVLKRCLGQARKLDEAGIDHGELSNARRHVIIREGLKPVILDFGKASEARRPRNVTSLFSYITHGPHSEKILRMLDIDAPLMEVARSYKMRMDDEAFRRLLEALNLER